MEINRLEKQLQESKDESGRINKIFIRSNIREFDKLEKCSSKTTETKKMKIQTIQK